MRSSKKVALVGVMAVLASLLLVIPALATHGQQVIPDGTSIFEIDNDANLKVDDVGNDDWVSIPQGDATGEERRQEDTESGPLDESFVQGTKEDTAVPVVETGSIPPNKSDLLTFGGYLETTTEGDKYLNIFWHRVQEPQGTTNMDFEFNHNDTSVLSANGITPVRTEGDVLIQYDLPSGGSTAELFISRWVTDGPNSQCEANGGKVPCWNDKVNLTDAGDAVGTINQTEIVDDPLTAVDETDGLGTISPRTFGEAQIDFGAFAGGDDCVGFGSAYLKSRSSDSFTSALKDFIPPIDLAFNECGAIEVTKTAKHAAAEGGTKPQAGVTFTVTNSANEVVATLVTGDNGKACVAGLAFGTYTVVETVPTGYSADEADLTKSATITAPGTCTSGATPVSFTNTPLTDLDVTVTSQIAGGTDSQISCVNDADPLVVIASHDTDATGTGTASVDDLLPGDYTCTITIDP
jgi:Prealbumin-like fold domain